MSQFTVTPDRHGMSIVDATSNETVIYQGRRMTALEEEEAALLVQSLEKADPDEWSTNPNDVDLDLNPPSN